MDARELRAWIVLGALAGAPAAVASEEPLWHDRAAVESFLRNAAIESIEPIGVGITKPMRVTLSDGQLTRRAVWKCIDEHRHGVYRGRGGRFQQAYRDSYRFEIAAYELDKILGLDLVPPTVERTIDGRTGSLQLWIEGAFTELDRRERGLEATDDVAWSNRIYSLRLLHQLTYNDDAANLRNVIYDPEFRAYAIDNSRSFRSYRGLADASGLRRFSRALVGRLGELSETELSRRLGPWLSRGQIEALLARRDLIVGRAERLAASIGEDAAYYP